MDSWATSTGCPLYFEAISATRSVFSGSRTNSLASM